MKAKLCGREPHPVLTEAEEAADIGLQLGDPVVCCSQECCDLTEFLSIAAIDGLVDPSLGILLGQRQVDARLYMKVRSARTARPPSRGHIQRDALG